MAPVIYIHVAMFPLLHAPPPPIPDALRVPDWPPRLIIFNNKQATHQAADNRSALIWTGKNGPA